MKDGLRDTLVALGTVAFLASPLAFSIAYDNLNSKTTRVETSRGRTFVREWTNGRGREVINGSIISCAVYTDLNRDGIIDTKTFAFGAPKRGYFITHPSITNEDQTFYSEAVAKAKNFN